MAELNTRIRLKYDSFENWSKAENQFDLLAGEIAIAYLGETKTETSPDNGTHPILFKVGPGKFNDLPWASALAADVYAWAKKARGESTDIDYTKTVKEMADGEVVSTSTTKITVQSAIDALYSAIETLSGDAGSSIADLIALINKNKDDIATINSTIGKDSTEGLRKDIADRLTKSEFETFETSNSEAIQEVQDNLDNYIESNNNALAGVRDTAEKAYVLPEGGIEEHLSANVKASLAKADNAATAETVNGINERVGDIEADYLKGADKEELEGKITTAETNAKAYADEIKEAILGGEGLKDTFDTLLEIQTWIEGDGVNTTELTTAIATETKAREDADAGFETRVSALEEKVDVEGKVSDAIATGVAGEATLREEADTALSNRIKAYEDNKDTYAVKTEVEAEITKKANTADLHAVATSGKIEDLIQTEEYIVFNCGSATSLV